MVFPPDSSKSIGIVFLTKRLNSRDSASSSYHPVVDLSPQGIVLVYNCYYMTAICGNLDNFANTPRGQALHPGSGIPGDVYGYDLNTGGRNSRQYYRRKQSCPTSWKKSHSCPEIAQEDVFRHDGKWFTTAIEPGTTINQLANQRDQTTGRVLKYSQIRYTCDEFPPASWVEGGDGSSGSSPSTTRCAAWRCGKGVKAEQNWQGTAHGVSAPGFPLESRCTVLIICIADAKRDEQIDQGKPDSFC
jgi:hypothetical protein